MPEVAIEWDILTIPGMTACRGNFFEKRIGPHSEI